MNNLITTADFKLWEDSFWGEYFSDTGNSQNGSGCWSWILWHLDITYTNLHYVFTVYGLFFLFVYG